MDKKKAPRTDGLDMAFFQTCWAIVMVDLMKVFNEFHYNSRIPPGINSTFIVLKKDRSIKVCDFRPISIMTSIYKIIT